MCVLCCAHKKECARERFITVPNACFLVEISCYAGTHMRAATVLFFCCVSETSVSYLRIIWRYLHCISSYPYGDILLFFVRSRLCLVYNIPLSHLCDVKLGHSTLSRREATISAFVINKAVLNFRECMLWSASVVVTARIGVACYGNVKQANAMLA